MIALPRQKRLPSTLVFAGTQGGGNQQPPRDPPIDVEWAEVVNEPERSHTFGIINKLWNIGNGWLRVAIAIIALWPILITVVALIGSPFLTAAVTFLPLVAVILGLLTVFDPLVLAAIGTFAAGRKILMVLAMIVGSELAVGVFFSAVPVANDRGLIPMALVTMLAIVFFVLSGVKGKVVSVLVAVLAVIAIVSFMGGRDEVGKAISSTTTLKKAEAYPICAETLGGVKVTLAKPEANLKLNSKCRSGWVELPNGGPRYRARITSPGDLEIVFWDGRPPMLVGATESIWAGYIQNQTFRLRGEGVAKIKIELLSAPAATSPTTPPPATKSPPPTGVMPLPPARPISPNGGVV